MGKMMNRASRTVPTRVDELVPGDRIVTEANDIRISTITVVSLTVTESDNPDSDIYTVTFVNDNSRATGEFILLASDLLTVL